MMNYGLIAKLKNTMPFSRYGQLLSMPFDILNTEREQEELLSC